MQQIGVALLQDPAAEKLDSVGCEETVLIVVVVVVVVVVVDPILLFS
jgi:hypothetical protein